jgi:radical SAM superfamily enzyme YgiQ (UPF0313 family)
LQSIKDTEDFIKKLNLPYVALAIATPYPGTEMWEYAKSENSLLSTDWSDYFHIGNKSYMKLKTITREELDGAYKRLLILVDKTNTKNLLRKMLKPKYLLTRIKLDDLKSPKELFRKFKIFLIVGARSIK